MRIRLIHITSRRTGNLGRREERIETDELLVGRGTDNALSLEDLSVDLHHARLVRRGDEIWVEAIGRSLVLLGGNAVSNACVSVGDSVRVGQIELRRVPDAPDEDLVLEVRNLRRRGAELEDLLERARIGIERGLFKRDVLSGLAVFVCLGVFVAFPLSDVGPRSLWSIGALSRKHALIANDCGTCHTVGFARVPDSACLECHAAIPHHVSEGRTLTELDDARCASCHRDHDGESGLVMSEQPLCANCHADLHTRMPDTRLPDASDFGREHPELRLFLPDAETGEPTPEVWSPDLVEKSGIEFSHWTHVSRGVRPPDGEALHLRCDACHSLDGSGQYMAPVSFEDHCQSCHPLTFDRAFGDAEVRHGDPALMREELRRLYSERALAGRVVDRPAPRFLRFRRPGRPFTDDEKVAVREWVTGRVRRAEAHLFEKPGECARCHELDVDAASDGGRNVSPVHVTRIFMPRSEFRHDTHGPFSCRQCHPAAAVFDPGPPSDGQRPPWADPDSIFALSTPEELAADHGLEASRHAGDVLVLGRENCRRCHAGADASPPMVPSECALCHEFHKPGYAPMAKQRNPEGPPEWFFDSLLSDFEWLLR